MRNILLAFAFLCLCLPAQANTGCQPFQTSEFQSALTTVSNPVTVDGAWRRIPFGTSFNVSLPAAGEMPLYVRAFARPLGEAHAKPVEFEVLGAARKNDDLVVTLRLDQPPWDSEGSPWWSENYAAVFLGCPDLDAADPKADGDKLAEIFDGDEVLVTDATEPTAGTAVPPLRLLGTTQLSFSTLQNGIAWASIALFACLITLFFVSLALGRQAKGLRRGLKLAFSGLHYRVSLSKFQLVLFSITVIVTLAYAFGRTNGLSDLSTDVLLLLGISAASATVATISDRFRSRLTWDNWVWLAEKKALRTEADADLTWFDLVRSNGEFDVNRFQALVFTLLVAPAFAIAFVYSLDTATIPPGILAVLGLSQVTYLAGKLVAPPTMQEFDAEITKYRALPNPTQSDKAKLTAGFKGALEYDWPAGAAL